MVIQTAQGETKVIDAREVAPAAARERMFAGNDANNLSMRNLKHGRNISSSQQDLPTSKVCAVAPIGVCGSGHCDCYASCTYAVKVWRARAANLPSICRQQECIPCWRPGCGCATGAEGNVDGPSAIWAGTLGHTCVASCLAGAQWLPCPSIPCKRAQ